MSEFTGNKMEGEKLERVYHKIKSGKASAAAVHSIGAGTSGVPSTASKPPVCNLPTVLTVFLTYLPLSKDLSWLIRLPTISMLDCF